MYLKWKVLFLCETNGLHSLMAEALLGRIDSEHFQAVSAGTSRGRLHPLTVEVMKEIGIDLSQKMPKQVDDLASDEFDYVITLDDSSTRMYRNSWGAEAIQWKFDDPIAVSSDPKRRLHAFRTLRDQLTQRLRLFVIVHVRPQPKSLSAA
jgi:protein-tyrosine-phosphatase